MEASNATAHHIKQVTGDLQVAQIDLMRHQWIDLPPSKNKRKAFKSGPPSHKEYTIEQQQVPPYKRKFDSKQAHTSKERLSKCGDSRHIEGFKCTAKNTSLSLVISMDILPACVSRNKYLSGQEHPKHISYN